MPTEITLTQFALIVGTILGLVFGLILLIIGYKKNKLKLGILGFVLSLIAGAIFSMLGILPVFGIFLWLFLRKPKVEEKVEENLQTFDDNTE